MTEEGAYNIQISGKVHGDLVVVRGADAVDLAAKLKGLAESADDIVTSWSDFKTAAVAKGIFTGDAVGGSGTAKKTSAATSSDNVPTCKHGAMKDLSDKGYKSTHYCTENDRDKQCRPINLRK